MADALKAEGNKLFAEKKFEESIEKFTQAIDLDPSNHVLYSNRSGAYASLKDYKKALEDADKVIEIKPDWSKGYGRKGTALHGLGDLLDANDAFEEALKLDPKNASAKSGLESVGRAMEAEAGRAGGGPGGFGGPGGGLGNMFNSPDMLRKLAANPKTAPLLGDADFMKKLQQLQKNPNDMSLAMSDPRFMQVLGVMLGIDMELGKGPGAGGPSASQGSGARDVEEEDVEMPDVRPSSREPPRKEPEPERERTPDPVPEEETEESKAAKKAKIEADELKKKGTEFYKKRKFDEAIENYTKAFEIHKDITYLTNLSAAKFEKGDYDGAIEACQQAVDFGREVLADFKLIAKAFARIGSSYEKKGDLTNAILFYQKAQTEHRTPEVLAKLRAAEKNKITAEKEAYVNPEKAAEARELGNAKFKAADWPAAVEAYSEWIKRAPDDVRGYSNRAACFIKLLSFPSAITDCDEAIRRDPKFIKAYLRKSQAYFAMREYSKCIDVCTEATEHDEGGKNAREIQEQESKAYQAQYSAREGETEEQTMERVQRDPEIVSILQDPVMQSILQQAKEDPAALQEHLKNPGIRTKVQKLVSAGVIRMGR